MSDAFFPVLEPGKSYLISTIGIPFSGKTTYLIDLSKKLQAQFVSFDDILASKFPSDDILDLFYDKAVPIVLNELDTVLRHSQANVVIYDAMNLTENDRANIRKISARHNRECLFLYVPMDAEAAIQNMLTSSRDQIPVTSIYSAYQMLNLSDHEKDIISVR